MALVKCPDCGKEVSDRSEACPHCGCPGKYFPGRPVQMGSLFMFGKYKGQDIEWRVLCRKGERYLLITNEIIDCMPFHNVHGGNAWSECSLREWLNNDFLFSAFSDSERQRIVEVTNSNGDAPDTLDSVFLLSVDEARSYFRDDGDRVGHPTPYTEGLIASNFAQWSRDPGVWNWSLRTPGCGWKWTVAYVEQKTQDLFGDARHAGQIEDEIGQGATDEHMGLRPAMWITG